MSNIHFQNTNNSSRFASLYKLLSVGVIDFAINNSFYLSPSLLITNEKYKIGVNLPEELLNSNQINILKQTTGLTFFNEQEIDLVDWDLKIIKFNFDDFLSSFINIYKIPSNWNTIDFPTNPTKVEKFNVVDLKWYRDQTPTTVNSFYKVYPFQSDFFDYYFYYNRNWYKITLEEIDKINLAKTILLIKDKLTYNTIFNTIQIPKYFPLPSFIEKLFFLNHCLNKGGFPTEREYFIESKNFKKANKVIFNNHIKITANE